MGLGLGMVGLYAGMWLADCVEELFESVSESGILLARIDLLSQLYYRVRAG